MFLASLRRPELRKKSLEDPGEHAYWSTSFPRPLLCLFLLPHHLLRLPSPFRMYLESGTVLVGGGSGKGQAQNSRNKASSVQLELVLAIGTTMPSLSRTFKPVFMGW